MRSTFSFVLVAMLAMGCKKQDAASTDAGATAAIATGSASAAASTTDAPSASASIAPLDTNAPAATTVATASAVATATHAPADAGAPAAGGERVRLPDGRMVAIDSVAGAPGQTVGVPAKNGDCPRGWLASVSEANKCDKECTTDAQCGPGNRCRRVGPVEVGKQCQRR